MSAAYLLVEFRADGAGLALHAHPLVSVDGAEHLLGHVHAGRVATRAALRTDRETVVAVQRLLAERATSIQVLKRARTNTANC